MKFTRADWSDALSAMKSGEYDVIDTAFYSEERDTWLDFSEPYLTIDVPIFHSEKISGITGVASLHGLMVAVKVGTVVSCFTERGWTKIEEFPSYESIIDAAKNG
ncbi:MAG: transporter substrate-binding domain-containing protein [Eubacteriales bacterium]